MRDLEKFTEFLYGDSVGYVYTATKKGIDWNQYFYFWPQQREELHDFIRTTKSDADVYVAPSLFSEKSSKKTAIKTTSVVWVEFDGQAGISFKGIREPDVIVQSSTSTHLHCYWKIEPSSVAVVEEINRRLTYHLGADYSGWDAGQVLRPPETINWKTVKGKPVTLSKFDPGEVNSFATFDKAPTVRDPIATLTYEQLLDPTTIKLPDELKTKIFRETPVEQGGRSTFLMSTGHLLAENNYSYEEIVSLLYAADCRIKKFVGRADQLVRLGEIASIALFKYEAENTVETYSPLDILRLEDNLEWIQEKWLHSRGLVIVSGAPGVGKTQFTFDLAYRLATGKDYLGKTINAPVAVNYWSLEMDLTETKYVLEHQVKEYGQDEQWNKNLRVIALDEFSFQMLEKSIERNRPAVIFIDSLSELFTGDSNEQEAKQLMRWFKKMRRNYKCSFVIVHHNRKAQDSNKAPNKLSDLHGSYIFAAKAETVISLWCPDPTKPNELELFVLKARFDRSEMLKIRRTENLTFVRRGELTSVSVVPDNPLIKANLGFGD